MERGASPVETMEEERRTVEAVRSMHLILFDGVCNLCNGFIQFVIRQDKNDRFRFGALQSPAAQELIKGLGNDAQGLSTILYLRNGKLHVRSSAALNIFRDLGGAWWLLYAFIVVPRPLRDLAYDWVARNRYRWFGKQESCMMPTPELKRKFPEFLNAEG